MKKTFLFSYWLLNVAFMISLAIALTICALNIGFDKKHQSFIMLTFLVLLVKSVIIPLKKRHVFKAVLSASPKKRKEMTYDENGKELIYNQVNAVYSNSRG